MFFYVKHIKIWYFLEYVNQRNSAYIVLDQIEHNVAKYCPLTCRITRNRESSSVWCSSVAAISFEIQKCVFFSWWLDVFPSNISCNIYTSDCFTSAWIEVSRTGKLSTAPDDSWSKVYMQLLQSWLVAAGEELTSESKCSRSLAWSILILSITCCIFIK